jgi:predicted ArsR family transcriptional regulator
MRRKTPPEKEQAIQSLFLGEQFLTYDDIAKQVGISPSGLKRVLQRLAKTNRQIAERVATHRQRWKQHRASNQQGEKPQQTQEEKDHIARILDECDDSWSSVRDYLRDELRPAYCVDRFQDPRK